MKIVKNIAIVLVVLLGVYIIVALFGKPMVHVERTTVINADPKVVFDQVNNLKNWKSWSYWDNIDPNMKSSYEGPEAGVGAKHLWESKSDSVGKGTLTITKSEENKFVETELFFDGMGTSLGGWKMKDTTGGVAVTTYMDMNVGFFARPIMMMMDMDKMLGVDFEKSLAGLKKQAESVATGPSYTVEERTVSAQPVVAIRDTAMVTEIGAHFGKLYGEIGAAMGKAGLKQAGPAMATYYSFSLSEPIIFEAGIITDKPLAKADGRVKPMEIKAGKTAMVSYYGAYENLGKAHEAIDKWAKDNNKKLGSAPWELYVSDPMMEKDTAKWLTEIYYSIEE